MHINTQVLEGVFVDWEGYLGVSSVLKKIDHLRMGRTGLAAFYGHYSKKGNSSWIGLSTPIKMIHTRRNQRDICRRKIQEAYESDTERVHDRTVWVLPGQGGFDKSKIRLNV